MQNNRMINFKETQQMPRNALAVVLGADECEWLEYFRNSMQTDSNIRQQPIESSLHVALVKDRFMIFSLAHKIDRF